MHRRLYTPRQRRSYRRRQLLRDLILGAAVVALAQIVAPRLPFLQQLEAQPVESGTRSALAGANLLPGRGR